MKYLSNSFETWYVCSTITCVHPCEINLNLNQYFIEKKISKNVTEFPCCMFEILTRNELIWHQTDKDREQ